MLALDFVSTSDAAGAVTFALAGGKVATVNSTSFAYDTIGHMHQATLDFAALGAAPGQAASYVVRTAGGASATFTITPLPVAAGMRCVPTGAHARVRVARAASPLPPPPPPHRAAGDPSHRRYAVWGDFGLVNDESMTDIVRAAKADEFDAVLHVGDWAYDFEDLLSITGNAFMNLAQGYMSIKPVTPAEGARARAGARARHGRSPLSHTSDRLQATTKRARCARPSPTFPARRTRAGTTSRNIRRDSTPSRSRQTRATTASTRTTPA